MSRPIRGAEPGGRIEPPQPTRIASRLSSQHPDYRPDIDGLRAVAVGVVVAFHAFPALVPGGFIGVDIFFVISGFLISRIVMRGLSGDGAQASPASFFAHFYARRIRRIFPALLLVMAACLVAGWSLLMADDYKRLGKHTLAGVLYISNLVLRNEAGYFDAEAVQKPLLHLWSLGVEEQFYIFFPLLIAAAMRWQRSGRSIMLPLLGALFVVSFAWNMALIDRAPVSAFFYPHTRVWELLIGSVLAHLALQHPALLANGKAWVHARSVVGAALILAALIFIEPDDPFPGWRALLPVLGSTLLISAGMNGIANRVLALGLLRWVGLFSYPLYLWHWPILSMLHLTSDEQPSVSSRVVAVVLSAAAAWLTWRLLERRVQARQGRGVIAGLVIAATALGIAGAAVSLKNGFASRFPNIFEGTVATDYPYNQAYRDKRCLLAFDQTGTDFADECKAPAGQAPQVFVWGDSHAAHWYPGLSTLENQDGSPRLRIAQYTAGGCPPALGMSMPGRPQCAAINEAALSHLKQARPDYLVVSANWAMYDGRPQWGRIDPQRLAATIDAAAASGVDRSRIVLIGPVPAWHGGLPKVLLQYSQRHGWSKPPERTWRGVDAGVRAIDDELRDFAGKQGISYVSPLDAMCNVEGCLTRVGNSLTNWDYGHLTTEASAFVLRGALPRVLPGVLP